MRDAHLSRFVLGAATLLGAGLAGGVILVGAHGLRAPDRAAMPGTPVRPRGAGPAPAGESFAALRVRVRQRIARLGDRLPPHLVLLEAPPFLVVGEEPRARVQHHLDQTIRWADRHLRRLYFHRPPRPLEVWLGADAVGYAKITRALLNAPPTTPYGFYMDDQRMMIMNIQTGGGTLVHELVHAYMEANFPDCPPWFNEGLGSLYEMVGEKRGRMWGFVNWRLPPLQEAIRKRRTLPFAKLMALSQRAFYRGHTGVHYGQSRYLLYYLQTRGKLVSYFRRFLRNHATDPTGLNTLQAVLGHADLEAFRARWEHWVLGLRYAPRVIVTQDDAAAKSGDPSTDPTPALR